MCHCITPQALLAGLVRRVEREGYVPSEDDLTALERLGCGRAAFEAALARLGLQAAAPRERRAEGGHA